MKTYLFYDLETTGLNKAFDQVLQFAAIRTDMQLQELERHEIRVKLRPDVIPAPMASITHRISISDTRQGINEVDAIRKIHQIINKPGTISLGYNTLNFDDEFLRFSFYRNLLPPYTHQFANECGRQDIYPMTVMFQLYKPSVIDWPKKEGRLSLKLESLNNENDLASGQAHDAMVDVEVTIALAKRFFQEKEMWNYIGSYFNKADEQARILKLPICFSEGKHHYHEALLVLSKYGSRDKFQAPVLYLGQHRHYKNQHCWLRLDLPELAETTIDTIKETTWSTSKKLAETGFLLPPSKRFLIHLSEKRQETAQENKNWLQDNPKILKAIQDYYLDYTYPKIDNVDIDAALYLRGFLSRDEQALCEEFHRANLEDKITVAEKFQDKNNRNLAMRILARNYNLSLPEPYQEEYQHYLSALGSSPSDDEIIDYREQPHLTAEKALDEINRVRQTNLDAEQTELLAELENYLKTK